MTNVFVYGTLMKGYWNHRYLEKCEYLGKGKLAGYEMYRVSSFPGIVQKESESVIGEVYKVDEETLKRLDKLEAEGTMYIRKKEDVIIGQEIIEAYVYVWNYNIDLKCEKVEEMPWQPKGRY